MKVVLLAAGKGTRLWPLTSVLPKCLMPIQGRPQLEFWLRAFDEFRGEHQFEVVVNTHYLAELVRAYIRRSPWAEGVRLVHEDDLLGTGGTLLANCFPPDGPVMLVHADNLTQVDLPAFLSAHEARAPGVVMTMMSFRTDTPSSCGILRLDERGRVQEFCEKVANPPGNLANAAVYIVEPEVTEFIASLDCPVVDFSTEVIPHFLGRIQTWENTSYHRDIGTLESLLAAQQEYAAPGWIPAAGQDGWQALCERDGEALPHAFARVLAQALQLPFRVAPDSSPGQGPVVLLLPQRRSAADDVATLDALAPGSVVVTSRSTNLPPQHERLIGERGCRLLTFCTAAA